MAQINTSMGILLKNQGSVSAKDLTADDLPWVYPNPAGDVINIAHVLLHTTLDISDMTGRIVYSTVITNSHTSINTEGFVSGIYLIRIMDSGIAHNRTLVIDR